MPERWWSNVPTSWKNPTLPASVLRPIAADGKFHVERQSPAVGLVEIVDHFALVTWDLPEGESHRQEALPDATVQLVIDHAGGRVNGVRRGRRSHLLVGSDRVFGVSFRPAGFRAVWARSVAELTDRSVELASAFGDLGWTLEVGVREAGSLRVAAAFAESVLARCVRADLAIAEVNALVDRARADSTIRSVRELAVVAGVSERQLQRRFREYVGIGPKWVIRTARLRDAARVLAGDDPPSLADLALELGYVDQAHFTNDFTAQVGEPPGSYARGNVTRP